MFNDFASIAQRNVFTRLFNSFKKYKTLAASGLDEGRDKSKAKFRRISRTLLTERRSQLTQPQGCTRSQTICTESLLPLLSAASCSNKALERTKILYDEEKIDRILRSTLSAPTTAFPVALVSNDIEVFPQSIKKISLRYYRQPRSIEASGDNDRTSQYYFDFTVANGVEHTMLQTVETLSSLSTTQMI